MKSIRLLVIAFCLTFSSSAVMAMQYIPKEAPWQHIQPNGTTTFMAVQWGYSFMMEYETDYGYTIIQSPDDSYWYYAELDSYGEYTPSSYKVGIDNAPPGAFHLRRSPARMAELEEGVDSLRHEAKLMAEEWAEAWGPPGMPQHPIIGVLLIEFWEDHRKGKKAIIGNDNYSHFDLDYLQKMIMSQDVYNWNNNDVNFNQTSDGYPTCGSVRDYWNDMSNGQIDFVPATFPAHDEEQMDDDWIVPAVPERTFLINPLDDHDDPIWLDMSMYFDDWTSNWGHASRYVGHCADLNWLPDPVPGDPIYPGFDIIIVIYGGVFEWANGAHFSINGYKSRVEGNNGDIGFLSATMGETQRAGQTPENKHLIQVPLICDEIFDPFAYDLYPFGDGGVGYGNYPRGAPGFVTGEDDPMEGGIIGGFDNASMASGDWVNYRRPDGNPELNNRPVGNTGSYWNPRDRIKKGWFGSHIELEEDLAAYPIELEYDAKEPTYYSYKYVDSYEGETPIYGQFWLENRRVMTNPEVGYKDFNSKSVGWALWTDEDDGIYRKFGYVKTPNANNLLIWHAEDEGPQLHVQFGDGHACCSNQFWSDGLTWQQNDGFDYLNGNDYFPGPKDPESEPQREFGPGTFQNRGNLKLDYSSIDLIDANEATQNRAKQTGFCLKEITAVDDEEEDGRITCDVYTNYWGGDVDEDLVLTGENIYLGQDCEILDGASITLSGENNSCTAKLDDDVIVKENGVFQFRPEGNGFCRLYLNGESLTMDNSPGGDADGDIEFVAGTTGHELVRIYGPGRIFLGNRADDLRIDDMAVFLRTGPWSLAITSELSIGDGGRLILLAGDGDDEECTLVLMHDIYVEEGGRLYMRGGIEDHQNIRILGPGSIRVEGGVDIGDALSARIVFTSGEENPAAGDWQGIVIDGLDTASVIENVDIEYAVNGIKATNCGSYLELNHVTITDFSSTGINLVNSSPTISYCSASDCEPAGSIQPVGLYCYGSCPKLTHSTFDNNYRGAEIIGVASVAYAGYNSFSDNHDVGIYFYDATGYLYNSTGYPNYGYNHIITNGSDGLYADGSAYPYLGYGSMGQGMNSIYSNFQYEVNNQNPAELQAENNWWGSCGGPLTIYGPVDYTPWLYSPPGGGPAPRKPDDQDGGGVIAGADDDDNPFHVADSLFVRGRFAEALQAYGAHAQDVASEGLLTAIRQIRQCYAELDRRNDWHGLLERLLDNRRLRANLRPLIVSLLAEENAVSNPDDAVEMIEATLDDFDREDTECAPLLFQIAMIQHYRLDNPESATRTLRDFLESFREHPLQSIVERELAVCLGEIDAGGNRPPVEDSDHFIPNIVTLYDPQPNPFNSSTTISYSLPERVHVRLMLYDVSGRQIETLVDRVQAAGEHALVWNAESLAAGMYICKLKAGDATDTVKLVMIK